MSESEFECFNFRMCATATHYWSIKCNSNDFKCIQMWVVLFFDGGQRTFHLETRPSTSHSAIARVSIQLTTWVTIQDSVSRIHPSKRRLIIMNHGFLGLSLISYECVRFVGYFWHCHFQIRFVFNVPPRPTCSLLVCSPGSSPKLSWNWMKIINQLFAPQATVVLIL